MKLYYRIMNLLFPPKCVLCGKILKKEELDLCRDCREGGPYYPAGKRKPQFLDSFVAVWYYEGYVRKSLLRYKFYGARHLADSYGRLLAMKLLRETAGDFDCLTWVPVSRLRKLRRGYDQVELLAVAAGKELGLTPVPLIKKVRHNRPQSRIRDAAKRRGNVLGVYRETDRTAIEGKRIVLLDDILTTGATVSEVTRVLKTAGAKEVHCAVMAAGK